MAKVAHPFPAAVPRRAPENRSSRADDGAVRQFSPASQHEGTRPPPLRSVRAGSSQQVDQITPPGFVPPPGSAGLPDLAERLARAGMDVPPDLLQAHAHAVDVLLQGASGDMPSGCADQAAATLGSVYQAFLARLPDGPAAAGPLYQDVASSFMAHALLINQVKRSGSLPGDLDGFLGSTLQLPPSRFGEAVPRTQAR
jgi:hypothetical protein